MTVLSNPAGQTGDAARTYQQALLDLAGNDEPLAALAAQPANIRAAIDGLTAAQLRIPEAPGKWSIAAVLGHLADSEIVAGWRLRIALGQDDAPITGYDQDQWAINLRYQDTDPGLALRLIEVAREANVALWRAAYPDRWERFGVHAERGKESVGLMAKIYVGHDRAHIRQIGRIHKMVMGKGE